MTVPGRTVGQILDQARAQAEHAPPKNREDQVKALNFARSSLAPHEPSRAVFVALAQRRYGWSAEEAEEWAKRHVWTRD